MSGFPLSNSVRAGDWLVISGQLGFDGDNLADGIEEQARCAFENLRAVVEAHDLLMSDVVKTTVFLTSMANYESVNSEYARAFHDPYPARSAIAVRELPCGGLVEIEAWAYLGDEELVHG